MITFTQAFDQISAILKKSNNLLSNQESSKIASVFKNMDQSEVITLLNTADEKRSTLFMELIRRDYNKAKELAKYQGININLRDRDGKTALMIAAQSGRGRELIEALVEYPGCRIELWDYDGNTAFSLAKQNGHEGIVKALQAYYIYSSKKDSKEATKPVAQQRINNSTEKQEIKSSIDIEYERSREEILAERAKQAIGDEEKKHDEEQDQEVLNQQSDSTGWLGSIKSYVGGVFTTIKSWFQLPESAQEIFLINEFQTIVNGRVDEKLSNYENKRLTEIIFHFLKKNDLSYMDILFNAIDEKGVSNVIKLLQKEYKDIDLVLLHSSLAVNYQDEEGTTLLMLAISKQREEIVDSLTKRRDLKVHLTNNRGQSALDLALEKNYLEIFHKLVTILTKDEESSAADKSSALNLALKLSLKLASESGNLMTFYKSATTLIEQEKSLPEERKAVLEFALQAGDLDILYAIMTYSIRIGKSLFHEVIKTSDNDMVSKLLVHGIINLHMQVGGGKELLAVAEEEKNQQALGWLLQYGVPDDKTSMHKDAERIFKIFSKIRGVMGDSIGDNYKALYRTNIKKIKIKKSTKKELEKIFSRYKGNELCRLLNYRDKSGKNNQGGRIGNTVLMELTEMRYSGTVGLVQQCLAVEYQGLHPLNINAKDDKTKAAVTCAAKVGNVDLVRELLKHPDIDVNYISIDGLNPLHLCVRSDNYLEMLEVLLDFKGTDINKINQLGASALIMSAIIDLDGNKPRFGAEEIFALLLEKGARTDIKMKGCKGIKTIIEKSSNPKLKAIWEKHQQQISHNDEKMGDALSFVPSVVDSHTIVEEDDNIAGGKTELQSHGRMDANTETVAVTK